MTFIQTLRNKSTLIIIGVWIVGFHWGWQKMQYHPLIMENDKPEKLPLLEALEILVPKEEK